MDPNQNPKPAVASPVVVTAEDTEKEHLQKISDNLNQALEVPEKSTVENVKPAFDQPALSKEAQKQAEKFEEIPVMENPPDKDSFWRHILTFRNKKVGDVSAKAMFKAKSEVVEKKGGQEKAG